MKFINEIFSGAWSEALVWTLIHSLWQGVVILIALVTALRFIPGRDSSTRYITASIALTLFVLCSVITYTVVYEADDSSLVATQLSGAVTLTSDVQPTSHELISSLSTRLYAFVESNLYVITCAWMIGAFLFSLRMVSGFLYLSAIKKNAVSLQEEWTLLIDQLIDRIGLNKAVAVAESSEIKVPFVVGFFKPIILLPVGMMSGLSARQVETILVHELMHIKRNDYLVNIIQSIVESVFFFNPFVWVISSLIRKEREHCCDDEVVKYGDPISYAYALTRIEELNLKQISPALSLAENKNQLLKRIKRIMEKSVQNYSVKERIVPVVLLIVGLICASWFSIRPTGLSLNEESSFAIAQDTTPKKKSKSKSNSPSKKPSETTSQKKITITDREGNAIQETEIRSDGTGETSYDFSFSYDFATPPIPPIAVEPFEPLEPPVPMTPFAPMHPMEPVGVDINEFSFPFSADANPGMFFSNEDWKAFSEDFQLKFKEKFGDFYKKHGEEMDKMMKEMGENFKTSFDQGALEELQREAERNHELSARHMQAARADMERSRQQQSEMAEQRAQHAQGLVQEHQEMLKNHQLQLQRHQEEMRADQERMRKFERELKDELVKDGYLNKDEHITNMHWKDNEKIEINGKEIKKEHQQKYHELHRRYFKHGGSFIFVD